MVVNFKQKLTSAMTSAATECWLKPPCEFSDPEGNAWPLVLGSFVGLAMAYGIGANDAANSWGTSVGSGK